MTFYLKNQKRAYLFSNEGEIGWNKRLKGLKTGVV